MAVAPTRHCLVGWAEASRPTDLCQCTPAGRPGAARKMVTRRRNHRDRWPPGPAMRAMASLVGWAEALRGPPVAAGARTVGLADSAHPTKRFRPALVSYHPDLFPTI